MNDVAILREIQSWFLTPGMRVLAIILARWLIFFFVPFVAVAGLFKKASGARRMAYEVAWSCLVGFSCSMIIGRLVTRVRPFRVVEGITALIPPPYSVHSFPSSHTTIAFAIAMSLALARPRLGVVAFIMAGLVGFGRMAVGVHYPTDVLAGALLGMCSALLVRAAYRVWLRWEKKPLVH
ncbi:MAG: phosphatase PAP2 family protein [Patescibacteria group bacterium]